MSCKVSTLQTLLLFNIASFSFQKKKNMVSFLQSGEYLGYNKLDAASY